MELIADGLLLIAAVTASLYCIVLSRRLRRLTQMEDGIGKAIADMSFHVEEMNHALARVKSTTSAAAGDVDTRLSAARAACARLEAATASAKARADELEQAVAAAPTPAESAPEIAADMSYADLVDEEIVEEDEEEPAAAPKAKAAPRAAMKKPAVRVLPRAKTAHKAVTKPAPRPARELPRAARGLENQEADEALMAMEPRAPVAAPRMAEAAPRAAEPVLRAAEPSPRAGATSPGVAAALGAALSSRGEGDHEALARRLIAALSGGPERSGAGL